MKIKYLFSCLILALLLTAFTGEKPVKDCQCKNISLYGKVRIVEHHADFKVRIVEHQADLHVQKVEHHPNACGRWQFVDHHEDFSVQFVDHHQDFSVKYVSHHPGTP
jgi:hypothetical protein